jgi:hypothetical protein
MGSNKFVYRRLRVPGRSCLPQSGLRNEAVWLWMGQYIPLFFMMEYNRRLRRHL